MTIDFLTQLVVKNNRRKRTYVKKLSLIIIIWHILYILHEKKCILFTENILRVKTVLLKSYLFNDLILRTPINCIKWPMIEMSHVSLNSYKQNKKKSRDDWGFVRNIGV